jgi:DNA-binding NarL/FixJ family response regulator
LTAQQVRVLQLLGTGKLNKEIAYELDIAEPTVKVHVSAILQKLKVYSRTQAAVLAGRLLGNEPLRDGDTRSAAAYALGRHERQVS